MTDASTPVTLFVSYQGSPDTPFDRDYYVREHLAKVRDAFGPHGLESAAAFFPAEAAEGTICLCELRFRDADAMQAAFASPEAPAVNGDVVNFTAVTPAMLRAAPLPG